MTTVIRLRTAAYPLLLGSVVVTLFATLYNTLVKNFWAAVGGSGAIGAITGLVLSIIVVLYSRSLRNRGMLR